MKTRLLFALVVLGGLQMFISSSAYAEDCSPVDVSAQMGPIRNQGDIGWCYANAAADLLGYRYRHELRSQPVSALYTALMFNQDFYVDTPLSSTDHATDLLEGGWISLAMRSAIENGLCPRTEDELLVKQGLRLSLKQKLQMGIQLKKLYDLRKTVELRTALARIRASNSVLNKINDQRLYQIMQNSTSGSFLKNLADQLCVGKKFVPTEQATPIPLMAPHHANLNSILLRTIDLNLTRHNPVGVSYHMSFFDGWDKPARKDDRHASVIVGRQMRGKQCYYKLRNSWGAGCNYKNPNFKQGLDCDKGYLWIPKSEFKRYLFGVTYLTPDNR